MYFREHRIGCIHIVAIHCEKKLSPWWMKETYGGSVRSAIKGTRRRGENRVKEAFKVHECE